MHDRGKNSQEMVVSDAINKIMREDKGRLLAGLISRLRDFSAAEDALQEALIQALASWQITGVPNNPSAWLMRVALNKGIDRYRGNAREAAKVADYGKLVSTSEDANHASTADEPEDDVIADERLRLIFTCCHPALEEKSRVALTLRTVCGLTTKEIAAAFLDNETAMAQRLSRTKAKIRSKGIGYSIPSSSMWSDRLGAVLSTIYLIFTTGYLSDALEPRQLCKEGLFLSRLLLNLRPKDAEIEGAMALMLFAEARRNARVGADGASIPTELQDRSKWNEKYVAEGQRLMTRAVNRRNPGPFQIKAAIADCHMAYPKPDWRQMSLLYQSLWLHEPTSVVALNWSVVMAEMGEVELAYQKLLSLADELAEFQPWYAAHAKLLAMKGLDNQALEAYQQAIARTTSQSNLKFLHKKMREQKAQLLGTKST